jgi:hypothetical protein
MTGFILVVVSAPELRRSIEFVLGAEGYIVGSHGSVSGVTEAAKTAGADCIIIDEDDVINSKASWDALGRIIYPIVLLTYRLRDVPALPRVAVVTKPMLGGALVDAVRGAGFSFSSH